MKPRWFSCLLLFGSAAVMAVIPAVGEEISAEDRPKVFRTLLFTDEIARIVWKPGGSGSGEAEISLLDCGGISKKAKIPWHGADGQIEFEPLGEGIHVIRMGEVEVRFLAINPPPALRKEDVRQALPRTGDVLFSGGRYRILALGDSVTATGDYPEILAMMLRRATGNQQITAVKKAHPGCSVDASVRNWKAVGPPSEPHLGLIMYGLNDQGAGSWLWVYREQVAWLAGRLRDECGADVVFLQPTPHINILGETGKPEEFAIRTIPFADALYPLGRKLGVPVAETFHAIWGAGGGSLKETARRLWPLYPQYHRKPFTSLIEIGGEGDTIHPNALGHLLLARAVFESLGGRNARPTGILPDFSGTTFWREHALVSRVRAVNSGTSAWSGTLEIFPGGSRERLPLDLSPQEEKSFEFPWPEIKEPGCLLEPARKRTFLDDPLYLRAVSWAEGGSRVFSIPVPMENRVRIERHVTGKPEVVVVFEGTQDPGNLRVAWDAKSQAGRIPILHGKDADTVVGEVSYVRVPRAKALEPILDGDVAEWKNSDWVPLVARNQMQTLTETRTGDAMPPARAAFAKTPEGIACAFQFPEAAPGDTFTVWFDPRPVEKLGTIGPYFWVWGKLLEDQKLMLRPGDTSPPDSSPEGTWRSASAGTTVELLIPYEVLGLRKWPTGGLLGASLQWRQSGKQPQFFEWGVDGHPWNPTGFGLVRPDDDAGGTLWRILTR